MKQKQKIILGILFFLGSFSITFAQNFSTENTSIWLWYSDTCNVAESNHIVVTPSTIPTFWTGNTTYDFEAGTYNLAGISLTQPCTALVGTDWTVINGNWTTVITISSNYNIIKNLIINGNAADALSFSNTNSNTISNTTIYWSNRWILLTTTINTIIKDTKIFWNSMWISLLTNSNNNVLNNIITFNNSQNWIFINGWYRNIINNSISFNNTSYGFLVQAGIQNVFNNSTAYNNNLNGIRTVLGSYFNSIKLFNNIWNTIVASSTWYGLIQFDISLPVWLKLWLSTDPLLWTIWWQNWNMTTWLITTENEIFNPHDWTNYLIDTSTATGTRRWVKPFWDNFVASSSSWWSNLPNQIQPVQRNTAGTQLENSSLSFSASKKIGEIIVLSPSWWWGWWGASSIPICGNKITEQGEQCDDGNKRNWDGCTATCQAEQPGICWNWKLEYMEECDDSNKNDGDGCAITCQIESASLILSPKLLLQQKALEKTFGMPAALIDLKEIETTSDFILSTINQNQKQQIEQCQYMDTDYRNISFDDNNSTYKQQVETLLNYCIIQWKQLWKKRFFGNKETTSYSEFIKVLVKSHFLGSSVDLHNNTFNIQNIYSDVSKNAWYAPYIIKAYVHDLLIPIEKFDNNKIYINPEKPITKLDAIRLLIHSLKLVNKDPKNIEIITDTFQDANTYLTREEMAALIVYWYQLDYSNSLRMKSNNAILIKLLADNIKKYTQPEQLTILKSMIIKIEKINEKTLKKLNIYKEELLADIKILIDFSEVFLH